tara:strand:+ start:724 stop:1869 length:1146 start_codon:yes stop_codon:yes gene_type:complete
VVSEKIPSSFKFKRQLAYGSGIFITFLIFSLVIYFFQGQGPETKSLSSRNSTPEAWYKSQSPPPEIIAIPDGPLFRDEGQLTGKSNLAASIPEGEITLDNTNKLVEYSAPSLISSSVPRVPELQQDDKSIKTMKPTVTITALPRWKKYAVDVATHGNKPMIAIVIDDMGIDRKRSALTISLKAPLTLSFLTYAKNLEAQTKKARQMGHELLLHVSMEPRSTEVDPGPNALLINLSEDEIRRRLNWGLSRFSTYVGLNNHMGSKFTADRKAMRIVMKEIKRRGLLFLDSRTSNKTVGINLAKELGVPVVERNIFLDHENTVSAVNAKLLQVERFARRVGAVIAIGHPRDVTIKALRTWLESVESRGFQLVPLTTIVKKFGYH